MSTNINDDMLGILADKYGIDKTAGPSWKPELFNQLCEQGDTIDFITGYMQQLEEDKASILPFEVFVRNAMKDPATTEIFKSKLRKLLVRDGFEIAKAKSGEYTIKDVPPGSNSDTVA